ncbi:MAG: XdhC family protein [Gammaproteobacteria bacterium]|nr:XdhC family protein [Gammaproteobacteria bacterium]
MRLLQFFDERAAAGSPLVLVSVFETRGSTYSKAGAQMMIDGDGKFSGMLSGGCLEGDLVERARHVISTGVAETATYDLGADDELWGLGVGCDGTMRILLQPLSPEHGYQPFAAIADIINGTEPAILAIVTETETESAEIRAGASLVSHCGELQMFGIDGAVARHIAKEITETDAGETRRLETPAGRCDVVFLAVKPPPSLLILGAGPDAEPVARFAAELGWRLTVCDHRPAYIDSRVLPQGAAAHCCPASALAEQVSLDTFDVAIVMSHHLASDRAYLAQLAMTGIGYVGLLGPAGRRDRLLGESTQLANKLEGRLHAPAGIDFGGRGPGPIALSIVAEMQRFLHDRG